MDNNKNTMTAFLLGLIAGGVTALLLAPDSGRETRRRVREGVRQGTDAAAERARRVREQVGSYTEEVRRQAQNLSGTARDTAGGISSKASAQVEAVKEAWHEGKEAYRRELEQRRAGEGGDFGTPGQPGV